MFFSPRITLKPLASLCRRLGTSLEAGIDIRTVLSREAQRAHGPLSRRLLTVSDAIDQGHSLAGAFALTDDFFPPLFHEMIGLGEETGHLEEIGRAHV